MDSTIDFGSISQGSSPCEGTKSPGSSPDFCFYPILKLY